MACWARPRCEQLNVPPVGAGAADRAVAGAAALDAVAAGAAHDRGQRAGIRAARLRGARRPGRCPADHEGHRRQGAGHAHAAVRRGHAFIEFSPYWNVPPSIARQETVPRLRRDPAYFEQQGFEFVAVRRPGGDHAVRRGTWMRCCAGRWRIRQRPGPQERAGRHQVRLSEQRQHLPAPHARPAAVRAGPARFQPRLHPRAVAGGRWPGLCCGTSRHGPKSASARRWSRGCPAPCGSRSPCRC